MKMKGIYKVAVAVAMCVMPTACRLPVAGYGDLSGTVTDASTGSPLEEAAVVYGDSAVYTSMSGSYVYSGLPDGLQGVWFRKDGYYSVMRQVGIPDGGSVQCDVALELVQAGWAVGLNDSGYGAILHSDDGGRSWVRQGTPAQIPDVRLTSVSVADDMTCWAAGDVDTVGHRTVILKTEDGGMTWSSQSVSGLSPVSISSIVAQDADTAWAVCADTCLVLKTENGGSSWNVAYESSSVLSYTAVSVVGTEVWVCGSGRSGGVVVEYTRDGGSAWSTFNVDAAYAMQSPSSICAVPGGTVFLAGTNAMGILRSDDGGATWRTVLSTDADMRALDAYDGAIAWAGGGRGSFFLTVDGFQTNISLSPAGAQYADGTVTSVSFLRDGTSGVFSVISQTGETGSIYHTSDGGQTWSQSTVPFEFSIESVDFVGGYN